MLDKNRMRQHHFEVSYVLGRFLTEHFIRVYKAFDGDLTAAIVLGTIGEYKLVMKCGEINLRTMELLDAGNTGTYGHPVPTKVPLGTRKGTAILVSGHDLRDIDEILKQSAGKGIFVYSHGEMLPAHAYPGLNKHQHFYGHFGTAWQNQRKEFAEFPGAIVMTTNCIQKPQESYMNNIFTTGLVGWPGVNHIGDKNFAPVIEKALSLPGFPQDSNGKYVTVGFARNAVFGVADKVIEAVKNKKIRHFFLVAGCDGAKAGRNYYTEFVEKVPEDSVVLTLACGKFRLNGLTPPLTSSPAKTAAACATAPPPSTGPSFAARSSASRFIGSNTAANAAKPP